jgi:hypothetical protein
MPPPKLGARVSVRGRWLPGALVFVPNDAD